MYHFFVRRHLREVFAHLNAGDFAFITRQFAPDAVHWFAGEHALSGERTSPAQIVAWYKRLGDVFPGIRFDVKKMVVSGPPWRTHAAVEWVDEVKDRHGRPLPNRGVFVITLRWGKAVDFRVYCDTQRIERSLALLSQQGVSAAAAAPIVG